MKIFITGATGYIGFNVAEKLRSAGHEVWGLTRSRDKFKILAQHEIHPVTGNMQEPNSYKNIAENCSLLIHAAFDYEKDGVQLDKLTVETFIESGKKGSQPKTIIYTSGCWIYGDTNGKLVDETSSLKPAKMVEWRPAVEQTILNASEINGIVVRPGIVYGKQGGLTGLWFKGALINKKLKVIGDGNNHWTMVHVDDLAEAYLLLAEKRFKEKIFNISDGSQSKVKNMVNAVALASGYTDEIEYIPVKSAQKTLGGLAETLAMDQHVDGRKATGLLGWQPKFSGFLNNMNIFLEAWKAYQNI